MILNSVNARKERIGSCSLDMTGIHHFWSDLILVRIIRYVRERYMKPKIFANGSYIGVQSKIWGRLQSKKRSKIEVSLRVPTFIVQKFREHSESAL